jgi:hypothetical protein
MFSPLMCIWNYRQPQIGPKAAGPNRQRFGSSLGAWFEAPQEGF